MKFHLMSDLHLEFSEMEIPDEGQFPETVLLLAGDVAEKNLALDFVKKIHSAYHSVILVPGNHEYYGTRIDKFDSQATDLAASLGNFYYLNPNFQSLTINDETVTVIGGCLWTDLNRGNPIDMSAVQFGMNDYRKIKIKAQSYRRLRPMDVLGINIQHRAFFKKALEILPGKKIVVSHHAPTQHGITDKYRNDSLTCAYFNHDLDDLFEFLDFDVWCHGHQHNRYQAEYFGKKILCNPRGYVPYEFNDLPYEPLEFEV